MWEIWHLNESRKQRYTKYYVGKTALSRASPSWLNSSSATSSIPLVTRSILVPKWRGLVRKGTRLVHSILAGRTSPVRFWTKAVQIQTRSILVMDEAVYELLKLCLAEEDDRVQSCFTNITVTGEFTSLHLWIK